jgi:ribA/ribD-fused uncharacterized protein
MINKFRNQYDFLSNFYPSNVFYEGVFYPCAENAFQAAKTLDASIKLQFSYISPAKAKRLGSQVDLRSDWNDVKAGIMLDIVRAKFTQNAALRKRLLDTSHEELIEGNTWHDNFWGACDCEKCGGKIGKNTLGKILMQVREEMSEGVM